MRDYRLLCVLYAFCVMTIICDYTVITHCSVTGFGVQISEDCDLLCFTRTHFKKVKKSMALFL